VTMQTSRLIPAIGIAVFLTATVLGGSLRAQNQFQGNATWAPLKYSEIRAQVMAWRDGAQLDEAAKAKIDELWPADAAELPEITALDRVAQTLAAVIPAAQEVLAFCNQPYNHTPLPEFAILKDESQPALVRYQLRLVYGRWLVQNDLYDEALQQLEGLTPEQVVAPATLLFHQSVAHHRLLQKEECLPTIARLLENEDAIPRRYREVARLMAADIEPLKQDSLDEVSRIMDDVRRRLRLARAGKRVRDQEDDVIAKLDKMIKDLEEQQKQQQQQQQAGANGSPQSNRPLDDSQPAGGQGPGNVAQRDIGHGSGWGNLPPKEREEALQDITKNLPNHYRAVIEEYFRKLARSNE